MRKWTGVVMACFAVVMMANGVALGLHASADLICSSCHTMHDSKDGGNVGDAGQQSFLLKNANISDLCLSCHDGSDATAPQVYGAGTDFPGGDFDNVAGDEGMGHNIVSTSKTIAADSTLATGPGGTVSGTGFKCTDCHDAHGNANYRNLIDGNDMKANSGSAVAPTGAETVLTGWAGEGNNKHNGYQSGFSNWCANCHGDFHTAANTGGSSPYTRHPVSNSSVAAEGQITAGIVTNYGVAYQALVPFEDADLAADVTTAPDATNSKVFCLTCHRAHGSAYADATRWNMALASGSGAKCNRCHAK